MEPSKAVRLTPAALSDLEDIWRFTFETWGLSQAENYVAELNARFEWLSGSPGTGRQFREGNDSPRIYAHRSHIIAYRHGSDGVEIIRVLHSRRDWERLVERSESAE